MSETLANAPQNTLSTINKYINVIIFRSTNLCCRQERCLFFYIIRNLINAHITFHFLKTGQNNLRSSQSKKIY